MKQVFNEFRDRIALMLGKAVVKYIYEPGDIQRLQLQLFRDEVRDRVPHIQPYGFQHHPNPGAEAFVAFQDGDRTQGLCLTVGDRRYRLKLEPGEVAINDDLGNVIKLGREAMIVNAVQKLNITSPTVNIDGELIVSGHITSNEIDLTTHIHTGDDGGDTGGPR